MSNCTESDEPVVSNPFAMMFPEHLSAMVTCAESSSLPSRHYSPLDKPTPTSVRTPQMQAADLLIEALAEVEDASFARPGIPACSRNHRAPFGALCPAPCGSTPNAHVIVAIGTGKGRAGLRLSHTRTAGPLSRDPFSRRRKAPFFVQRRSSIRDIFETLAYDCNAAWSAAWLF